MTIFKRNSACVKAMVFWLQRTQAVNLWPLEQFKRIAPHELETIIRSCEQARQLSDGDIAQIERDTSLPYRWKYARGTPCPYGCVFLNPQGGNAYHAHNQTDKAVHRAAQVAIEVWKETMNT